MLCVPQRWGVPLQDTIRTYVLLARVVLPRDPMIRHVASVRVASVRVASVRAHSRHRDKRCRRATASPRVNQARLSATATNDAPSTMVVVATTIATTRVQAKILDCSNVTRLTTRAKRRVRINKTPSTAHDTNCRNLPALLFNSGAIQSHSFAKRKPQIDQTKNLSAATIQKGRTRTRHHPFGRFIWLIIHLVDSARSFTDARLDLGTAQMIDR
jgi:hypothetical protein